MHFLRKVFLLLAVFASLPVVAQLNSPYSRIGIGNIYTPTMGASAGLAGNTQANFLPTEISFQNPAAYPFLFKSVLDVGVSGRVLNLDDGTDQFTSADGNLSYIAYGFSPDNNRSRHDFGASTGLLPLSTANYNIDIINSSTDTILGTQEANYSGTGGTFQYYIGLGYAYDFGRDSATRNFNNTFSVGLNYQFIFGNISNITIASFPDQSNSVDTKFTRTTNMQGGGWNAGLGYQRKIGEYGNLNVGLSFTPSIELDAKQSISWFNINDLGAVEQITDTLFFAPDSAGVIALAPQYHVGVAYSNYRNSKADDVKFMLNAGYSLRDWSKYTGFQYSDSLALSYQISVGAEIIPPRRDKVGQNKIPLAYRLGAHYGTSYLRVQNQHLNEFGMTFGLGIPMRGSKLNISAGLVQRGTPDIIRENYLNMQIGFNLFDANWFFKRRQN